MRKPHRMGRAGARSNDASDPRRPGKPGKSGERPTKPSRPGKSSRSGKSERFAKPDQPGGRSGKPGHSGKPAFGKQAWRADKDERTQDRSGARATSGHRAHDKPLRPPVPPRAPVAPVPSAEPQVATGVQTVTVKGDESGMRLDRFFEARFPGLSFSHIQRIIRKGEVRVNGKRADPKDRLEAGQAVRIPPLKVNPPKSSRLTPEDEKTRTFLQSITLHEDADVLVLNKPMGLAVQGPSACSAPARRRPRAA